MLTEFISVLLLDLPSLMTILDNFLGMSSFQDIC